MLMRVARLVAVLAIVVVLFLVPDFLGRFFDYRFSLLLWAMLSIPVLSVIAWRGRGFVRSVLLAVAVAVVLAVGPIDAVVRPGKAAGVQVLPLFYGFVCKEDTDCRGCIVPPNP